MNDENREEVIRGEELFVAGGGCILVVNVLDCAIRATFVDCKETSCIFTVIETRLSPIIYHKKRIWAIQNIT